MKGDFSRNTFDPAEDYTRVLMQQGRVLLDADWNEQAALFLHYMRTFIMDLIGPYGGPGYVAKNGHVTCEKCGFEINSNGSNDLTIGIGSYYVNGIRCQNVNDKLSYLTQAQFPNAPPLPGKPFLVYLDVWERHITCLQDENIREVALNGPDTTTRAQIVCQVKVTGEGPGNTFPTVAKDVHENWEEWVKLWQSLDRATLKAQTGQDAIDYTDPCLALPEAGYRGNENQLYRVEIHYDGDEPTFKWSRDNGSIVFPIDAEVEKSFLSADEINVKVKTLGRDDRTRLRKGDWVEFVDDDYVLKETAEPLWQVKDIDEYSRQVTLTRNPTPLANDTQSILQHPILRRWDQKGSTSPTVPALVDGTVPIIFENAEDNGKQKTKWMLLENGISIQFQTEASSPSQAKQFRTGDYWLIPARVATGDVIWPKDKNGQPDALLPEGVEHHYAPLAIFKPDESDPTDCRRRFSFVANGCP